MFRGHGDGNKSSDPGRLWTSVRGSFADSSLRRAWNTTRRRPGHGPWSDSELPFTRCPHALAYGGRRSSCDVRRRGRTPLRLGRREDAVLSLSRPAASFTSITASQKAATASHSVSLRSMAETNAGRERSPPIARREDTSVLCPSWAVLHRMLYCVLRAIFAVVTPRRFLLSHQPQVPPETSVSGEDLRHAIGQDAVTSLQPLLKEGSYRRDCGVPGRRLRQSSTPYYPELAPELFPPH